MNFSWYTNYSCNCFGISLATVTHRLVTSRLDCCDALYMGLLLDLVRKLQLMQNVAARLLTTFHVMPLLGKFYRLPICY